VSGDLTAHAAPAEPEDDEQQVAEEEEEEEEEELPAWSLPLDAVERIRVQTRWPAAVDRDWAFGGSTGAGVRVAILDSGIEVGHPLVGEVQEAYEVKVEQGAETAEIVVDEIGDRCGHGTACAGIVRALAPECELISVRVLGEGYTGSGRVMLAGLRWAIEHGFDIVNMSLSTTKKDLAALLHELADEAYFRRTLLVASAHNMPVESYPWRFSSVISVGSHEEQDPLVYYFNPDPPVEFFARGLEIDVAWLGGTTLRCTGNSFATPHISGISALILGKHPGLTPFQLKSILSLTANNVAV
jgi:subtilisin